MTTPEKDPSHLRQDFIGDDMNTSITKSTSSNLHSQLNDPNNSTITFNGVKLNDIDWPRVFERTRTFFPLALQWSEIVDAK